MCMCTRVWEGGRVCVCVRVWEGGRVLFGERQFVPAIRWLSMRPPPKPSASHAHTHTRTHAHAHTRAPAVIFQDLQPRRGPRGGYLVDDLEAPGAQQGLVQLLRQVGGADGQDLGVLCVCVCVCVCALRPQAGPQAPECAHTHTHTHLLQVAVNPVHGHQHGQQRALPLHRPGVGAQRGAGAPDGVDFINEDDAGGRGGGGC